MASGPDFATLTAIHTATHATTHTTTHPATHTATHTATHSQLMASGPDFATFNVPQGLVAAASAEKHAKTPKEERRFWGDKTDFCRCLETILNEQVYLCI